MKTKLSGTPVEKNTCWDLLGIRYWCRFFITCFFCRHRQHANRIKSNCKNRTPIANTLILPGVGNSLLLFPQSICICGEGCGACLYVIVVILSSWVLLSGACRGPKGFGAGILNFWMGSPWEPVVGPSGDFCVATRLCGLSGLWPVLFSHADSHHPGLPCSHPAAEGRSGGLLHEHPEHCAAGPEVSPGPSLGCGYHTQLSMYCPRVVLS